MYPVLRFLNASSLLNLNVAIIEMQNIKKRNIKRANLEYDSLFLDSRGLSVFITTKTNILVKPEQF